MANDMWRASDVSMIIIIIMIMKMVIMKIRKCEGNEMKQY